MEEIVENKNFDSELDKESLIRILTYELPVLRAKLGISQDEISIIIGISRQTYSSIETRKRKMSWNTFLSLILYFGCNDSTARMLDDMGILSQELNDFLSKNNRKG